MTDPSTRPVATAAALSILAAALLAGCDGGPLGPQVASGEAAAEVASDEAGTAAARLTALVRRDEAAALSAALDDLGARVLPALAARAPAADLAETLTALRRALQTGTLGSEPVERVVAALERTGRTPEAEELGAELDVARLALERALSLFDEGVALQLQARLYAREPQCGRSRSVGAGCPGPVPLHVVPKESP